MADASGFPPVVSLDQQRRDSFTSGIAALDTYLRTQASQDARRRIAAPFVITDEADHVIGYYTLSSYAIHLADLPQSLARKLPKYPDVPATLLGRLAVDQGHRGTGLGEHLLMDALHRSWKLADEIASFAVVVHAKDEGAIRFYARYDFRSFNDDPMKQFLPMKTIEHLFRDN